MPGPAFFEMLAARRFPTTTWLRRRDSLEYTPEPDIFHDVFGHVPMHAHPVFADFLAHYGQLCARIRDEAILELIGRVFWYTVEFGLIRQQGRVKVYGSGLISSNGECTNVLNEMCIRDSFDCEIGFTMPHAKRSVQAAITIDGFSLIWRLPVSYTHLDVYKRQLWGSAIC